ncbi:hypothetical protein AJE_00095 [Alishewanella jeotgali KCTC 22429]|uniref:Uncharacterized protein n=2 Tax=Alishewanella jeotgali TaxID=545533 RepID=H3Z9L8_9ALTE|nr:hypothetical protein AJE_00095 [Alishewanella jeotgali KCTC 22429]
MLESGTHAVDIAKKLVVSGDFQTGFREMIARGRPDLTFESIMLEDEFADLFTRQELEVARWRLSNVKN